MDGLGETQDVVLEGGPAGGDHDLDAHVLAEYLADLGGLERELARRDEQKRLDLGFAHVDLLEGGDDECGCFACAVLGAGEDVALGEGDGDGFLLDRRGLFEPGFEDAHEELSTEEHVLEFGALGGGDVFGLRAEVLWWWTQTGFP